MLLEWNSGNGCVLENDSCEVSADNGLFIGTSAIGIERVLETKIVLGQFSYTSFVVL